MALGCVAALAFVTGCPYRSRLPNGLDAGDADAGTDAGPATCAWGTSATGTCDDAVEVSPGQGHTCARRASGSVVCWGLNVFGELGDGSASHSSCSTSEADCALTPVTVSDVTDAVEISAGHFHTCARRRSGAVACWGFNGFGQLGDGSTAVPLTPTLVYGLTDAVEISAGQFHTCARRASGAVVCWGDNTNGRLGDGVSSHASCSTTDCSLTPVTVYGLTDAVEISSATGHTCARRASGSVVCWGWNFVGHLGDGTTTDRPTPVAVPGLSDAVGVAAGDAHTCALRASGAVVCWGINLFGRLGDGTMTPALTPVIVSGLLDAVDISAGVGHTCARRASGGVVCWGSNVDGELGDGTMSHPGCRPPPGYVGDCSLTPVAVSGLTDSIELAARGNSACARRASGAVVCWGRNQYGQLGDGTMSHSVCSGPTDCSFVPVTVAAPSP